MSVFRIALVQQKAVPNNPAANLRLAARYIQDAHRRGADLVLFPELWSIGYAPPYEGAFADPFRPGFDRERADWLAQAVTIDSTYVVTLRQLAKQLHIGICATYLSKTDAKPQNTAIIIGRDGEILLNYAKVHTCDFSLEALLQGGSEFPVCIFDGIRLGVMICFDREFPESARILMLNGAEIILVPNACDMNSARLGQLNTRAFENMVGIAMANYPAEAWGCSCAFSPIVFDKNGCCCDNVLAMADDVSQQLIVTDFAIAAQRAYRDREVWGNAYRKVHAYDVLCREISALPAEKK